MYELRRTRLSTVVLGILVAVLLLLHHRTLRGVQQNLCTLGMASSRVCDGCRANKLANDAKANLKHESCRSDCFHLLGKETANGSAPTLGVPLRLDVSGVGWADRTLDIPDKLKIPDELSAPEEPRIPDELSVD